MPEPLATSQFLPRQKRALMLLKQNCTGMVSFVVNTIALGFVWLIVPLENRFFHKVLRNRSFYFPHIDFRNLRPLDPVRIFIQSIFLMLFAISKSNLSKAKSDTLLNRIKVLRARFSRWLNHFFEGISKKLVAEEPKTAAAETAPEKPSVLKTIIMSFLVCIGLLLYVLCITQPFSLDEQIIFLSILLAIAIILFQAHTRITMLMLMIISIIVSSRYIWWRYSETINPNSILSVFFSWLLIFAETYAFIVMLLGYFQVCWVLDRKPTSMPADKESWPHVDIFIPTYNEPLDVVKPTVYAALTMKWPKEKLHVYILDDGSRKEFEDFTNAIGSGYIKRVEHNHAKAGNINHALTKTSGDFIAIFDCDHVPVRSFLLKTIGWFYRDETIALVQTPHHFYSQDPFEKNLHLTESVPNENSLFHDFIQKGNDTWNATMFCGSCAIIRRVALEEVGGIAVETVTEDAHTSLKLNRRGWSSAFLSTPLSAGLSTETLAAHIGQRIRWARGMIQIFRLDCPLFGKGLTIPQRLCFLNAMIHFLHGLPRIIFLLAPLPFLFGNIYVIYASAISIFVYLIPHIVHSTMTTFVIHKGFRFPFVSALYETILSWYIFVPTLVALFAPHKGKFNVTAKGGIIDKSFLDWAIAKPYLWILIFNVAGLFVGLYKMFDASTYECLMIAINLGWICYNLVILFAAIGVSVESIQTRKFPRVTSSIWVDLKWENGFTMKARVSAFSQKDCQISFDFPGARPSMAVGDQIEMIFQKGNPAKERHFDCHVSSILSPSTIEMDVLQPTLIKEMEFTASTFGTSDLWTQRQAHVKGFGVLDGITALFKMARQGIDAFVDYTPHGMNWLFWVVVHGFRWCLSFLPRWPRVRLQKINVFSVSTI